MQRRQFHRYPRPIRQRPVPRRIPDGLDRGRITRLVPQRVITRRARAFPQHIETIAKQPSRPAARARQRILDRLAQHKMAAHHPHRLAQRRAHRRQSQSPHHPTQNPLGRIARPHQPRRHPQRPRRWPAPACSPADACRRQTRPGPIYPRSNDPQSHRPARATAPRPAPSAPTLQAWSGCIRAATPRCRQCRRHWRVWHPTKNRACCIDPRLPLRRQPRTPPAATPAIFPSSGAKRGPKGWGSSACPPRPPVII